MRASDTDPDDFIFLANRLSTLVIEHALSLLPYRENPIETRTGIPYVGMALDVPAGQLCGVSILRSGASLEKGLRRVVQDVPVGSVLIQSDKTTGEPLLYQVALPQCLTASAESAAQSYVLLLDSQIGTGAAALMAVRILLDHGVREDHIIVSTILVSRVGGVWALKRAFRACRPSVRLTDAPAHWFDVQRVCGSSAVPQTTVSRNVGRPHTTARRRRCVLHHACHEGDSSICCAAASALSVYWPMRGEWHASPRLTLRSQPADLHHSPRIGIIRRPLLPFLSQRLAAPSTSHLCAPVLLVPYLSASRISRIPRYPSPSPASHPISSFSSHEDPCIVQNCTVQ